MSRKKPTPPTTPYPKLEKTARDPNLPGGDDAQLPPELKSILNIVEAMAGGEAGARATIRPGMVFGAPPPCGIMEVLKEVHHEVHRAEEKHAPMNSAHEAYAVIREEVDEYWDEVKADRGYQASARTELIQIAAMAVRAVLNTHDER